MPFETSRRGFLGSAAGLFAAPAGGAAAAIDESAGFRLGVASYSLREFQRGLTIRMLKELRVENVSIKEVHLPISATPQEWERGRREFERAGLHIVSGGVIYMQNADAEDLRRKFEYAKTCGMPLIVAGPSRESLPLVEKFVKEYNISVAIHNHGPEDKHFPTPTSVLDAVRNLDPRIGLCMDLGHTARTGADVVASLAEAGSRLLDVHIKDMSELRQGAHGVDVGDGAMPIPGIFKQFKKMGYKGCVNLEYEINGDNPMPGMQKSFAYMRGVLAGLAG